MQPCECNIDWIINKNCNSVPTVQYAAYYVDFQVLNNKTPSPAWSQTWDLCFNCLPAPGPKPISSLTSSIQNHVNCIWIPLTKNTAYYGLIQTGYYICFSRIVWQEDLYHMKGRCAVGGEHIGRAAAARRSWHHGNNTLPSIVSCLFTHPSTTAYHTASPQGIPT